MQSLPGSDANATPRAPIGAARQSSSRLQARGDIWCALILGGWIADHVCQAGGQRVSFACHAGAALQGYGAGAGPGCHG